MYGAYLHVPWCRMRCPYCAFAVEVSPPDDASWERGIRRDWARERPHFQGDPATLAFGGGTPSRADPETLARLVDLVRPMGEVSLEANPEDVDTTRLAAWRRAGVGRLSLGVQSFVPQVARRLGRAHTADTAVGAVLAALDSGMESVSIDLIFGVEGQDVSTFTEDLDLAVALGVDHVSLYGLTVEEGTSFARRGRHTVDDDGWRALYDLGVSRLREAGIERYEVSNFARGGHRSAHNEHYWRARRWVGLGPSAHGWRPDGVRVANPSDLASWSAGVAPKCERPTPDQLLRELLWSTLRHVDGVDRAHLRASTGRELRCPAALLREGLVFADAASVRLTEAGFPLADAIAEALHGATVASQTSSDSRDRAYLPLHRAGDVEGA